MKLLIQHKIKPRWHTLIRRHRASLKLNKRQYGDLFGVTGEAVYYWEKGESDPPSIVCWMIYKELEKKHAQK
jgi:DNA-binding XRE family transcriptional regulator